MAEHALKEVETESNAVSSEVTPAQMLQIAIDRGADLDKLEKFMELHERWEKGQARKAYVAALAAFKADPPTIVKSNTADFSTKNGGRTSYDFATLATVTGAILPALSKHGLSHSWKTEHDRDSGLITVTCTLTHIDGHSESVSLPAPADTSGSKNAIQAIASTVSYLERYTLLAITGLAAQDQDDDGDGTSERIDKDQYQALRNLLERFDQPHVEEASFCKWMKVSELTDIPARDYDRAVNALSNKLKTLETETAN